jgi:adenylate kinase family enzyme
MKILVFGNIGSGKSTLSSVLSDKLNEFELVAIDDFRKRYGDGTTEAEQVAKRSFYGAIVPEKNQIIEVMGAGDTGEALFETMQSLPEQKLIIILKTPLEECLLRLKERQWVVPYPAPPEKAFSLAKETNPLIRSGAMHRKWSQMSACTVIDMDIVTEESLKDLLLIIQDMEQL